MKKAFLIAMFFANQVFSHAQNVGVGTNNPTRAKLEVNGAVGATAAIFGARAVAYHCSATGQALALTNITMALAGIWQMAMPPCNFWILTAGYMALDMFSNGAANGSVNGGQRVMIITNEGRINIGSGAWPTAVLQVARNSSINGTAVRHSFWQLKN